MLAHPVELLPDVAAVVPALARDYRLLLITKGDLRHQERKIAGSGLAAHFHAVEIVSEKDGAAYDRIRARHGLAWAEFAMVGNSLKSDVLPVLQLGGAGVHVPYHLTWQHEHVEVAPHDQPRFRRIERLGELPAVVAAL
jgi:putative hydrolase of the HAD superfamily